MGASDPKKLGNSGQFAANDKPLSAAVLLPTAPARAFSRVPTHAIGAVPERRFHARAALQLPLRLIRVNGAEEPVALSLLTRNISTNGVFFLSPKKLELGMAIELEVALIHRPLGYGNVRMSTSAHVARIEESTTPGWCGVGARFDEIAFERDDQPISLGSKPKP